MAPSNTHRWQPHEDDIIRSMWPEASYVQIQRALGLPGVTEAMVKSRRIKLGLPNKTPAMRAHWTEEERQLLRRLWHDLSVPMTGIVKALHVAQNGGTRSRASIAKKALVMELGHRGSGMGLDQPPAPKDDAPPPAVTFARDLPPGARTSLPNRASATPPPDLEEWRKRRDAMRRRLEADGGNLTTERETA